MLNTEEFTKRIEIILNYYNYSAATFADKIGIQRSSLSHLLSGRNKPSLDFILKMVTTFPEIDLEWILFGKGNFPKNDSTYNLSEEKNKMDYFKKRSIVNFVLVQIKRKMDYLKLQNILMQCIIL